MAIYFDKLRCVPYFTDGMFPLVTTNALDQTITRTFEPDFGTVLTETDDANDLTTEYEYDEFGRVDYVTYPDGSYNDYTYYVSNVASVNHYIKLEASEQPTVTTYYDNFGRNKFEATAADGTTICKQTQYDNAGRISYESLPYFYVYGETIYWTEYQYDDRGYLSKQINPDETEKNFTKNGLTETVTDENNHTKTIIKDSLGRIKSVTEATTGTATYEYDIFDNLTKVTDPLGSETNIYYDDLGRKTSMDDPYMGLWEYGYDENGNLIYQVDGKGQETTMPLYDGLNRIMQKNYIDDGTQVNYTYGEGRTGYYNARALTTVTVNDGATTLYNYDNMGRVANEQRTISGTDYLIDREYDLAGRIEYITYPDNGAGRTMYKYTYDPIGTLREVRENGAADYLADFIEYNALGQVGSVSYKNNASIEYFYKDDGSYRLDNLVSYDGTVNANEIQNLTYTFDNVGNIETIMDLVNDVTHSFLYDEINRLTDAVATSSDPSRTYEQTFTYDLAGNIEEKAGIGGYKVMEWEDPLTHIKPKAVNFDDEVAGIADRTVEYNQDNKPTEITYAGGSITHLYYDGEGKRVKKVQGSNTVIYVGDIYEVREGQALSYIYANGKKIVTLTDDHGYYTHSDHLGSTSIVTDENGDAIEEIGYLPFGAVLFRNVYNGSTWESAYKFTGQEHDSEFELYNYDARLYDPIMGRFITPDIIEQEPYIPQSLNRYAYCLNNPLIRSDPSGNIYVEEWESGSYHLYTKSRADYHSGIALSLTVPLSTLADKSNLFNPGGKVIYDSADPSWGKTVQATILDAFFISKTAGIAKKFYDSFFNIGINTSMKVLDIGNKVVGWGDSLSNADFDEMADSFLSLSERVHSQYSMGLGYHLLQGINNPDAAITLVKAFEKCVKDFDWSVTQGKYLEEMEDALYELKYELLEEQFNGLEWDFYDYFPFDWDYNVQ